MRYRSLLVKDDPLMTYRNILAAVASDEELASMRETDGPQLSLAKSWEAYETSPYRRKLSPSTLQRKKFIWEAFVRFMRKQHPDITEVRHVTRASAEEYLALVRRENTGSTYNVILTNLRETYRNIMECAAAKENPFAGFPMMDNDSVSRREFTIEELQHLVIAASHKGPEWRMLFGIALYTGMRLGDCCRLSWSEVDIAHAIIQRIPEKTKRHRRGRPVTISIHKVLAELLCRTPAEDRVGFVLPSIGGLASQGKNGMGRIHHQIARIFHAAGIETSIAIKGRKHKTLVASFHSLRHTFVSLSANAGVPLHIIQAIVGHESAAMTRHYYHENAEALAQAVAAIPAIDEWGIVSEGEVCKADDASLTSKNRATVDHERGNENQTAR